MSQDTSLFGAMAAAQRAPQMISEQDLQRMTRGMNELNAEIARVGTTGSTPQGGDGGGGGGGGGGEVEDPRITAARIAAQAQADLYEAQRQERIRATIGTVKAAFEQYGLASLYPMVVKYAEMGMTEDEIYMNLRTTPEYKARFPAMEALSSRGQAISEAAYIDYERKAGQLEQMYGMPSSMVSGAVTDLLVGDVSLVELEDRLALASADAVTAPEDLKQQLRDYYNIDPDEGLRAYYLDPERALPILQKQSATARIGVQATRAGVLGLGVTAAQELQGLGVTEERAQQGFQRTAQMANLSQGRGDVVTQQQLISANLTDNAQALQDVQRAIGAKVGRFREGGSYVAGQQGVGGLSSAATR